MPLRKSSPLCRSSSPSHHSKHSPESKPPRQVREAWVTTAPDTTAAAQMSLQPDPVPPRQVREAWVTTAPDTTAAAQMSLQPNPVPPRQVREAWVTTAPDATAVAQVSLSPTKPKQKTETTSEDDTVQGEQP